VHDLSIRTATSVLTPIRYYSDVYVTVAGVTTKIRIHALPRELNLSYGLLLGRRWLKAVHAKGDYEKDTYAIADDPNGQYWEVQREITKGKQAKEIPRVQAMSAEGRKPSLDEESMSELEEDSWLEQIIKETSMRMGYSDSDMEDGVESGNDSDF
jgi:hypothetical protein